MDSITLDNERLRQLVTDAVLGPDFLRANFGGPVRGEATYPWIRVAIRPVELRGQGYLQVSYFDVKKNVTKNFRGAAIASSLDAICNAGFAAVHLATRLEEVDVRTTKKGKILIARKKRASAGPGPPRSHNRVKDVPLPEGRADRLLEALGILTRAGHVRPSMRAKYTQINEFLKQFTHVLDDAGLRSLGRPVEILDCGCGSSYLTLALHHYLQDVLDIPAGIQGVDINEEVIRKSVERSAHLGAEHLTFSCGRIGALAAQPDVVVALHACDTATDDALAQAVLGEARLLLNVPCCHHHLNDQLRATGPTRVLGPLLRHGILRQRAADLATDAFRALVLRIMGYRTEVVEFISTEHTARNLMLRAVRGAPLGEAALVSEYLEMRRFWGVTPYIEGILGGRFQDFLAAAR